MPIQGMSCLVCAFNEASRIDQILNAVTGHPLISQVIVVDDGSTDATAERVGAYPDVTLISYAPNRGKTYALARGIAAARGEHLMLLDADLAGLSAADIDALAEPVLTGRADVSLSLRRNSLAVYRMMGLDFISGERVMPTALLRTVALAMEALPRWGGEVFINQLIIDHALRVSVVDWPGVRNTPKTRKVGPWQGTLEEINMVGSALKVLSPLGVVRQNIALLKLATGAPAAGVPGPSAASKSPLIPTKVGTHTDFPEGSGPLEGRARFGPQGRF
ncbi:MAG: hypothetical protein JWP35_3685 [Caulobacter sp.]|nr:hypothetical protein [Caulobacter sp.]